MKRANADTALRQICLPFRRDRGCVGWSGFADTTGHAILRHADQGFLGEGLEVVRVIGHDEDNSIEFAVFDDLGDTLGERSVRADKRSRRHGAAPFPARGETQGYGADIFNVGVQVVSERDIIQTFNIDAFVEESFSVLCVFVGLAGDQRDEAVDL